jgi:PAXNEB protein
LDLKGREGIAGGWGRGARGLENRNECLARKIHLNFIHPTFMSFRRRNVGLSASSGQDQNTQSSRSTVPASPGVRPSPLDGRVTTSTGTPTLDNVLAGHAGLPLGTSLLVEENGTTDYAGALLRYFTAEGLVQGHHVHVVGVREKWGRELPGLVGSAEKEEKSRRGEDKMKIAWRYEKLGQFEEGASSSRGGLSALVDSLLIVFTDMALILTIQQTQFLSVQESVTLPISNPRPSVMSSI